MGTYVNAEAIVRYGFDFRKSHPGMYGDGVYFAFEACKSHQYTCLKCNTFCICQSVPKGADASESKRERTMIIARVALGDPYFAKSTLSKVRHPPERSCGDGLHDSVIANPGPMQGHPGKKQNHQEF